MENGLVESRTSTAARLANGRSNSISTTDDSNSMPVRLLVSKMHFCFCYNGNIFVCRSIRERKKCITFTAT